MRSQVILCRITEAKYRGQPIRQRGGGACPSMLWKVFDLTITETDKHVTESARAHSYYSS